VTGTTLVGIAGTPASGGCGCSGMGAYARAVGEDAPMVPAAPGALPSTVPRWVPVVGVAAAVGVMVWLILRMEQAEAA